MIKRKHSSRPRLCHVKSFSPNNFLKYSLVLFLLFGRIRFKKKVIIFLRGVVGGGVQGEGGEDEKPKEFYSIEKVEYRLRVP